MPQAARATKKMISEYQTSILNILSEVEGPEEQTAIMRYIVSEFSKIGSAKGIPETLDYAIEVIRKEFPHMVEDMEKLLALL